jgi:hypothetical protein
VEYETTPDGFAVARLTCVATDGSDDMTGEIEAYADDGSSNAQRAKVMCKE